MAVTFQTVPPVLTQTQFNTERQAFCDRLNAITSTGVGAGAYTYLIRKSGAVYEAYDSTATLIFSGADPSIVLDAVVATGAKYIFIKSEGTTITWIRDSIPANIMIEGDNGDSIIIQHSTPDAAYVSVGSQTILINVSVKDKGGIDQSLSPNVPRKIQFYYNARDVAMDTSHWARQFILVDMESTIGEFGATGIGVNQWDIGDNYWAAVMGSGKGLNIHVNEYATTKTGIGTSIRLFGQGIGLELMGMDGAIGLIQKILAEDGYGGSKFTSFVYNISERHAVMLSGTQWQANKGIDVVVPEGTTTMLITLPVVESSNLYGVSVNPMWETTVRAILKYADKFTLVFGTECPEGGSYLDWFIYR